MFNQLYEKTIVLSWNQLEIKNSLQLNVKVAFITSIVLKENYFPTIDIKILYLYFLENMHTHIFKNIIDLSLSLKV